MDDGSFILVVSAKGKMDVFGGSNVFGGKRVEAIEVLGVIADEAVDRYEFFYGGLIPMCAEFVREAPLL